MIFKNYILLFLSIISFKTSVMAIIDLDSMSQDFILETRQLVIPDYPNSFNPSIMRWDKQSCKNQSNILNIPDHATFLLTFRIMDPITQSKDQIGFIWLDKDFNFVSKPYVLNRLNQHLSHPSWAQDPRLITVHGIPYIVYNNLMMVKGVETRRMIIAQLHFDGSHFFTYSYEKLMHFEGEDEKKTEKNWVPFEYGDELLLSYSINPHHILKPLFGTSHCETINYNPTCHQWNWGIFRGGTTALLDGDKYLAFFHSVKDLTTVQSNGKHMAHYFMGAYTFSSKPPFNLLGVSPKPLMAKSFYTGPMYNTWKPLRVVFPCGFVMDNEFIWITYGRQDHECWVVKIDKEKLLKSLILL